MTVDRKVEEMSEVQKVHANAHRNPAAPVADERSLILTEPVSVLMPVYNEEDIIEKVVEEWHREVFAFLPEGSEWLFDDASNDATTNILETLSRRYPYIRVNHSPRDGFGNAAKRLYAKAENPLVFFTDSDGQYIPTDFWRIAKAIGSSGADGYDMLNGYKVNRKHPYYQIAGSALFNGFVRMLFSSNGKDINSAFKLVRRTLIEDQICRLRYVPTFINSELYIRAEKSGFRVQDIPVNHRARCFGGSKVSTPIAYIKTGLETVYGMLVLRKNIG